MSTLDMEFVMERTARRASATKVAGRHVGADDLCRCCAGPELHLWKLQLIHTAIYLSRIRIRFLTRSNAPIVVQEGRVGQSGADHSWPLLPVPGAILRNRRVGGHCVLLALSHERGGTVFLQHAGELVPDYTASRPRGENSP
jgi:hypothetical protein